MRNQKGFNFRFRLIESMLDVSLAIDFLSKQDLRYPHYDDWVQRTEHEIKAGYKQAILAFSGHHLVGDLVYQPHKELSRVREAKNMRIHPQLRRRDFAHFMLRQVEEQDKEEFDAIMMDVRTDNQGPINFLTFCGYTPIAQVNLYDRNCQDVIMVKCFNDTTKSGIVYNAQQLVLGSSL